MQSVLWCMYVCVRERDQIDDNFVLFCFFKVYLFLISVCVQVSAVTMVARRGHQVLALELLAIVSCPR